jgi:Secretion system C-terminal sorting domain
MIRCLIIFLLMVNSIYTEAQFTDRFWAFGDSSAIDFTNLNNPTPSTSILRSRGTCTSICDSLGTLLFYAASPKVPYWLNGVTYSLGYVVNKNHLEMESGDSIKTTLSYQEMTIVPDPADIHKFYLFHVGVTTTTNPGVYYSKINLSYNGGLGKVIQKNIQLSPLPFVDEVTAVKHGNGRDWWVIGKPWDPQIPQNSFYVFLIEPNGVSGPFIQNIGSAMPTNINRYKFNKTGTKLFQCTANSLLERLDFDRCTGLFSNPVTFRQHQSTPIVNYWSLALSPDDSKLYATVAPLGLPPYYSYLLQYDLNSPNVLATEDTLGVWLYANAQGPTVGMLQLGPDNKIYLSNVYEANDCAFFYLYCDTTWVTENTYISVINSPDSVGVACDFQPYSFYLGGHRCYYGLPNNPHYELGPDSGSVCDTLTVGINTIHATPPNLQVYYEPAWQKAFINASSLKGKNIILEMYDATGKRIFSEKTTLQSSDFSRSLEMSSYANGLYIISIITEKGRMSRKMMKY